MAAKSSSSSAVMLRSAHLLVSGKVQGVFYRKHARAAATELGLTGWVRNLSDGRVEVWAEGTAAQLAQLERWCHRGSPRAEVADVVRVPSTAAEGEGDKNTGATRDAVANPADPSPATSDVFPVIPKRTFKSFDIVR